MKLTFIRADHEVTGSCTLLEIGGHYGLIDCGMEQGRDLFENIAIPVPAAQIEFVLVTHAHMDHTGHLPLLYKQGFRGTVYATEATCDLCGIMLRDAAHIQMSEAEWKGRKAARAGQPAPEPLYTLEDVEGVLRLLRPCGYGKRIQVGENIIIRFTDVGHLLGSACIEAWLTEGGTEKKIVFSGDIGNTDQPIIRDPQTVSGADYVLIESTYGDRSHGPRVDYLTALADCIQRTLDRGGNVVIPSFAVGRTQELLYFIRQIKDAGMVHGHPHFPVYVDSPLANEATRVFLQTDTSFLDDEACALIRSGINPLYFDDLHTAVTKEDSMALNTDKTPKVILSSSGMCDAGRIRHHLKYNLWRPECTVLFVGYQAVGTLGRKLHDGAESVKIFGDEIAVHAEITVLPGVSGHADKQGLLGWINAMEQKPAHVFVNHGDDDACTAFAAPKRSDRVPLTPATGNVLISCSACSSAFSRATTCTRVRAVTRSVKDMPHTSACTRFSMFTPASTSAWRTVCCAASPLPSLPAAMAAQRPSTSARALSDSSIMCCACSSRVADSTAAISTASAGAVRRSARVKLMPDSLPAVLSASTNACWAATAASSGRTGLLAVDLPGTVCDSSAIG